MLVLTLIIAVLNICVGFALAIYMGSGLAGLRDFCSEMAGSCARVTARPLSSSAGADTDSATGVMETMPARPQPAQETSPVAKLNAAAPAELPESGVPENLELDEANVETSILRLNIAMMKSAARANKIDTKLRASQGCSDANVIEACVQLLRQDCVDYLAEQTETADKLHNRMGEFGEFSALGEEIETINLEQSAQVETTINNLQYMDFHTDPEAANLRLIEEIKNLNLARHKLHDTHEVAFLTVARHANRLTCIDERLFPDPLTRIYNRIGLEVTLFNWWERKLHQHHNMMAVLFDINGFGEVNQKFGLPTGDRLLYHVAQFLRMSIGENDLVGRYAGQQFVAVLRDANSTVALKNVDSWRQTIEKLVFVHKDQPIRITVSGAITLVDPTSTYYAVLEKLDEIIKHAKQAGPNRIFFHNGKETIARQSHDLGLQETTIAI